MCSMGDTPRASTIPTSLNSADIRARRFSTSILESNCSTVSQVRQQGKNTASAPHVDHARIMHLRFASHPNSPTTRGLAPPCGCSGWTAGILTPASTSPPPLLPPKTVARALLTTPSQRPSRGSSAGNGLPSATSNLACFGRVMCHHATTPPLLLLPGCPALPRESQLRPLPDTTADARQPTHALPNITPDPSSPDHQAGRPPRGGARGSAPRAGGWARTWGPCGCRAPAERHHSTRSRGGFRVVNIHMTPFDAYPL